MVTQFIYSALDKCDPRLAAHIDHLLHYNNIKVDNIYGNPNRKRSVLKYSSALPSKYCRKRWISISSLKCIGKYWGPGEERDFMHIAPIAILAIYFLYWMQNVLNVDEFTLYNNTLSVNYVTWGYTVLNNYCNLCFYSFCRYCLFSDVQKCTMLLNYDCFYLCQYLCNSV